MAELWELDNNSSPQKTLLYGDSKAGKTQLAATLAEKFKLHWFDLENGYKTLLKLPMEQKKNISLFRVKDSYLEPTAIHTMGKVADHMDAIKKVPLMICQDHGKVACMDCKRAEKEMKEFDITQFTNNDILVIDSMTQLTNSAYKFAMKKADLNPSAGDKAQFDQWGLQGALLERFLNAVQNADCHVVVITHESAIDDNEGKEKLYPLAGTKNFTRLSGKYFDHVVRCYKNGKNHLSSSSTQKFSAAIAGSRLDIDVEHSLLPLYDVEAYKESSESTKSATVNGNANLGKPAGNSPTSRLRKLGK